MKILATMPLYKFMDAPCVQALIAMICDVHRNGDHFFITFTQGENICMARNTMLEYAATVPDVDYIMCLDSDHDYSSKGMYRLIEKIEKENLPALSAAYRVRGDRYFSMIKDKKNITDQTLGEGVQECDVFGFGFVVFKPDTIRTLIKNHGKLFVMSGDTYTGEDYYFCQLMKKEGMKVCYDADTIIGHYAAFFNR